MISIGFLVDFGFWLSFARIWVGFRLGFGLISAGFRLDFDWIRLDFGWIRLDFRFDYRSNSSHGSLGRS